MLSDKTKTILLAIAANTDNIPPPSANPAIAPRCHNPTHASRLGPCDPGPIQPPIFSNRRSLRPAHRANSPHRIAGSRMQEV